MKTKIKMKKDAKGADHGFDVKTYKKGEEYVVGDGLAKAFVVEMKVAEKLGEVEDGQPAAGEKKEPTSGADKKLEEKLTSIEEQEKKIEDAVAASKKLTGAKKKTLEEEIAKMEEALEKTQEEANELAVEIETGSK